MLRALLPRCTAAVFCASRNPRALPPATLASLSAQLGGPPAEVVSDPHAALARAQELAGAQGAVLATGSIYLVANLVTGARAGRVSAL
jgi:dihydrofolate synthase/folylpolyglutamate synthase